MQKSSDVVVSQVAKSVDSTEKALKTEKKSLTSDGKLATKNVNLADGYGVQDLLTATGKIVVDEIKFLLAGALVTLDSFWMQVIGSDPQTLVGAAADLVLDQPSNSVTVSKSFKMSTGDKIRYFLPGNLPTGFPLIVPVQVKYHDQEGTSGGTLE